MTAALLVAGWFACGIAVVSLANAVRRAHFKAEPLPVWFALFGTLELIAALIIAIEIAVTRKDGGGDGEA